MAAPQDMDIAEAKLMLPSSLAHFCMLHEAHQFTPIYSWLPPSIFVWQFSLVEVALLSFKVPDRMEILEQPAHQGGLALSRLEWGRRRAN